MRASLVLILWRFFDGHPYGHALYFPEEGLAIVPGCLSFPVFLVKFSCSFFGVVPPHLGHYLGRLFLPNFASVRAFPCFFFY